MISSRSDLHVDLQVLAEHNSFLLLSYWATWPTQLVNKTVRLTFREAAETKCFHLIGSLILFRFAE